ncbi:endoglucanase 13-like [Salvia miltiorrhiza]|uniref:endoglucanase 13-like n=1 Tax=Salvia miltiorrhiza TaxID=226208 RepID=UPI0025AB8BC5|nr:endoglucanase 13-like [Salvia miltiorrhiza]
MSKLCLFLAIFGLSQIQNAVSYDYGAALTKSLLFYEAQRSGKLPSNQRLKWRGDSGLSDGNAAGVNLVGGYYDAGDNVKFGFPMAYTVTMLAWSAVEFGPHLGARHELSNALAAIKWGTDYLMKAHPQPDVLYGEVGDGGSDHSCWQRPEDMTTPRTVYKIDDQHPGSDLAGETAAALAAAALAFRHSNPGYSSQLITHAKQLFEFATKHTGVYQNSIPAAGQFYSSSGYEDELLWAAAWLREATKDERYLEFIKSANSGGTRRMFSWDDKYAGAQLLIAKGILEGKLPRNGNLEQYKKEAEEFVCNCIQRGNNNVQRSNGGLLWFLPWSNLQYVTSASFLITTYADILSKTNTTIQCSGGAAGPGELLAFARSQVDYILGSNPKRMSYMVGYGSNYPRRVHHRGASIVSIKQSPRAVGCQEGFGEWFHKDGDNPNVLEGAIVGGPDQSDQYTDSRENYQQAEPATANNAPLVGVLARLAS